MRHFPIAGEGFWVFPCVYGRKEPATKRGFYDASANPATIRRWFGGNFRCNLAVRTGNISGVWVLDVDDPQPLRVLEKSHGLLPVTRQSQSSRGYHFWFRTTGAPIPNSTSRIAANVDVKSENGYVIVAPSRHPDGVIYRWLNDEPLAVAPEWLVALARKPSPPPPLPASTTPPDRGRGTPGSYGAAALRSEIQTLAAMAPDTGRNNQLNKASFCLSQLVAGGELNAA